ncbi:transposase family protein [Streptomyces sp. NPDC101152]|uniref:transposase family protein n=1 Tax=Streptomyces sp. NPDC101152 TaxID=3366116 RepID=UPI00381A4847
MSTSVTCTAVLDVKRSTAEHLARLLRDHRIAAGTRKGPDGWPIWVSPVCPGRGHDTTCARHHGLIDGLNRIAAELDMPTLVDLDHENVGDGLPPPAQKPAGGGLTEAQQTYAKVIRGIHGVCERANSLLKATFKALCRVGLDPSRITKIGAAALVLLQLEYDRTI